MYFPSPMSSPKPDKDDCNHLEESSVLGCKAARAQALTAGQVSEIKYYPKICNIVRSISIPLCVLCPSHLTRLQASLQWVMDPLLLWEGAGTLREKDRQLSLLSLLTAPSPSPPCSCSLSSLLGLGEGGARELLQILTCSSSYQL